MKFLTAACCHLFPALLHVMFFIYYILLENPKTVTWSLNMKHK